MLPRVAALLLTAHHLTCSWRCRDPDSSQRKLKSWEILPLPLAVAAEGSAGRRGGAGAPWGLNADICKCFELQSAAVDLPGADLALSSDLAARAPAAQGDPRLMGTPRSPGCTSLWRVGRSHHPSLVFPSSVRKDLIICVF